jgi:tRNA threonylcarbamoyladenosine biosynthesis protein TsaB
MIILTGDTCLKSASVAVVKDSVLLASDQSVSGRNHSVVFADMVRKTVKDAGLAFSDMDRIACVYGPGSFTGVRIGLTFMKTLAYSLGREFHTLNTLDVLANCEKPVTDVISVPMICARNNEVFTAIYRMNGDRYEKISMYKAVDINVLKDELLLMAKEDINVKIMLSGDAQPMYYERFMHIFDGRMIPFSESHTYPDTYRASLLLSSDTESDPMNSEPFYLRESGAVRMKTGNK